MSGEELDKFEAEAAKLLKSTGEDVPVTESKLLSSKVLEILMKNTLAHGDVVYTYSGQSYSVSFGFTEVKLEDGNFGVYEELPEELTPEDAETVSFLVKGFHKDQETEVQFARGKIMLNTSRLQRHVVDFQRAVLSKGIF